MTNYSAYQEAPRDLLEMRQPVSSALERLAKMQAPAGTGPVVLTLQGLRRVLDLYAAGDLDDASIERWAEAVHGRDDIELAGLEREVLAEALFELSSPELFGPVPQIVGDLRLKVGGKAVDGRDAPMSKATAKRRQSGADSRGRASGPAQLMVEGRLVRTVNAALDPYRNWTQPREGVGSSPFRLASRVEAGTTSDEVSAAWPAHLLLPELKALWLSSREAWLFQDIDYGQWGLHILDPAAAAARTNAEGAGRPGDFEATDAVIGEFLGDTELLVLEANGGVMVALPLDPRAVWTRVASTLSEFLTRYLEAVGDKYWESP